MINESEISEAPLVRPRRPIGIGWIGQTAASILWIASVFVYGISETGDLLQLAAASAWLIANLSVAIPFPND